MTKITNGFEEAVLVVLVAALLSVVVALKVHSRRQHACEGGFCGGGDA